MARILVVDDSSQILEVLETALSESGHQVLVSGGARHAIQLLSCETVDLIIADVYMPDGDGLELLRSARTVHSDKPVIIMSGIHGLQNMLPAAELMGAFCTLTKPFSKAHLLQRVEDALRRAQG